jgi:hypothetical protein
MASEAERDQADAAEHDEPMEQQGNEEVNQPLVDYSADSDPQVVAQARAPLSSLAPAPHASAIDPQARTQATAGQLAQAPVASASMDQPAARQQAIPPMQLLQTMQQTMQAMQEHARLTAEMLATLQRQHAQPHVLPAPRMQGELEEPTPLVNAAVMEQQLAVLEAEAAVAAAEDALENMRRRHAAALATLQAQQQTLMNTPIEALATAQTALRVGDQAVAHTHVPVAPTAQQSEPKFKPPTVKPYGDKSREENRDAADFLDDLQHWIELSLNAPVTSQIAERKLVMLTSMHTEGKVRKGWRAVEMKWRHELGLDAEAPITRTWQQIRVAFHDLVGQPVMTRQDALDALIEGTGITQGTKSVVQYYTDFNSILMWCPDAFKADAVVTMFVRGLAEPYKSACSQDPVTLKPYTTLALVYEKAKGLEKARKHKQQAHVQPALQVTKRPNPTSTASPTKKVKLDAVSTTNNCRFCLAKGVKVPFSKDHLQVCPHRPPKGDGAGPSGGAGPGSNAGGGGGSGGSSGAKFKFGANSRGGKAVAK